MVCPRSAAIGARLLFLASLAVPASGLRGEEDFREAVDAADGRVSPQVAGVTVPEAEVEEYDSRRECLTLGADRAQGHFLMAQKRTAEWNAWYCQRRCKVTLGCKFFSWEVNTETAEDDAKRWGHCILLNAAQRDREDASPDVGEPLVIEGPGDCAPEADPGNRASCYNLNVAYDKDMSSQGHSSKVTRTPRDCLKRCSDTPGCEYYTWRQNRTCQVHPGDADANTEWEAISGPMDCSVCMAGQKRREGDEVGAEVKASTQETCRDHCRANPRCKYYTFWSDHGCRVHGEKSTTKDDAYAVTGPATCPGQFADDTG